MVEPNNYKALLLRGNSLEALNFNLDAIDDYLKALSIKNIDSNIYGLLGLVYLKIGDTSNAEFYLKLSTEKGGRRYEIFYNHLKSAPEMAKEYMKKKGAKIDNYKRCNHSDFVDDLSEVDENEYKKALRDGLDHLMTDIMLNPENDHFKDVYNTVKRYSEE